MQVKVTARGYINHRIVEPGELIEVKDGSTATWFTPVTQAVDVPAETKTESPAEVEVPKFGAVKRK